jgi:hypothetical protein
MRAFGSQGFRVETAQCVIPYATDETGAQAEIAKSCDGIADRSSWSLRPVPHGSVEQFPALALDKLHDAFLDPHQIKERIVRLAQNIDYGVADADNLITFAHWVFSS